MNKSKIVKILTVASLILTLFIFLVSVASAAQWVKTYGGTSSDVAYSIQQTRDGGYIVAGDTWSFGTGYNDALVLKLDADGNVQWQKTYGGTNQDYAQSVRHTSDGGYIVAGGTFSFGAGNWDAWVLKLDADGNVQWQKTYGSTDVDLANSIQQTTDGGYIVAGGTNSFGESNGNAWVLKLDSNGNVQWQKTYGGLSWDLANSIQQTSNGGYAVAGVTDSIGGGHDAWVLKLDGDGNVQWQKAYGGIYSDRAYSIRQTSDGGYIAAGYTDTESLGVTNNDVWVLKLDASGNINNCSIVKISNAQVSYTSASAQGTNVIGADTYVSTQTSTPLAANTDATVTEICYYVSTDIAVETPNGGENWNIGTTQIISWTYINNPGKVISIELLKGGTLFKTINPGVAIGKSGSGSYRWHIQSNLPTGNDYQIRISINNKDISDTSDNFFSIR